MTAFSREEFGYVVQVLDGQAAKIGAAPSMSEGRYATVFLWLVFSYYLSEG